MKKRIAFTPENFRREWVLLDEPKKLSERDIGYYNKCARSLTKKEAAIICQVLLHPSAEVFSETNAKMIVGEKRLIAGKEEFILGQTAWWVMAEIFRGKYKYDEVLFDCCKRLSLDEDLNLVVKVYNHLEERGFFSKKEWK